MDAGVIAADCGVIADVISVSHETGEQTYKENWAFTFKILARYQQLADIFLAGEVRIVVKLQFPLSGQLAVFDLRQRCQRP